MENDNVLSKCGKTFKFLFRGRPTRLCRYLNNRISPRYCIDSCDFGLITPQLYDRSKAHTKVGDRN